MLVETHSWKDYANRVKTHHDTVLASLEIAQIEAKTWKKIEQESDNHLVSEARTGSVTVPEMLAVRPAPGVWHLVSTVSARVPLEVPNGDLLAATFPPASVTGTPKTRARQLLSQWEPRRRGVYCGTVGMASPVAGCELNVAIRTVEFDASSRAVLGVGGGITADSDPDAEWQECLDKAAAIVHCAPSSAPSSARPPGRARSTAS
jgi:para-aminobenzoate synthetase component 1